MKNPTLIQVPSVDSRVRIRVRNTFAPNMIPPGPDSREYQGQVLKSYRWLTDRQFCLEGDADWPIRVINIDSVIDMEVLSGQLHDVDVSTESWDVAGSRGNKYQVTRDQRGWTCTCTGFQFRRQCRHVTELSEQHGKISA